MATAVQQGPPIDLGAKTQRSDLWWVEPAFIVVLFSAFVVYATFRVFENAWFIAGPHEAYLSPFVSPDLTRFVPDFMKSLPVLGVFLGYPAFLILPFPAGFRLTCYYYRKAYYRSFYASPPGCAVEGWGAGKRRYLGERGNILVLQNFHRYFLYAAIPIGLLLAYDALRTVYTLDGSWYFGLGSALFLLNAVLILGYTFGCHSFRHLVGGKLDCFSCDLASRARYSVWSQVTVLNGRHQFWALASLVSVAGADLYTRYLAMHPGLTHLFGVIPV